MPKSATNRPSPTSVVFSLLDTPAFGGAEQYLWDQLSFLAGKGLAVVVATNNPQVATIYRQRIKAAHLQHFTVITAPYRLDAIGNWKGLVKFWLALPAALRWCWQVLSELRRSYQQVVCLWPGFTDRLVFSPLAHWALCPLIWIEIGPLAPTFAKNAGFPRWLYFLTNKLPDWWITTSNWTRQSMVREGAIPRQKITLVYPSIAQLPADQLRQRQAAGRIWLKQHGLADKQIVAFVGRLAHENEVQLLVKALAVLKRQTPTLYEQTQCLIVGDGPAATELTLLAAKLGVDTHLTLTGFVTEELKQSLVRSATVFTFTRAWELDGFGMTTIEAMNMGTAVITSDFGPQKEVVQNNQNGLLFTPHNSSSLAKKITRLLQQPAQRQQLAQAGQKSVARFSHSTSQAALWQVLQPFC